MLLELSIRNFAIIADLNIRFGRGLTVLSGETGAGKSIIINAVNLLLGSRASATLIRTGAENAELEALFEVPQQSRVARLMDAAGYDPAEGLLVRRIISNADRHRVYINGRLATMQALGEITAHLASISGQHAHQGLLKEEAHLLVLDQFGGLMDARRQCGDQYDHLLPLIREEQELLRRRERQHEQVALLQFQQQELAAARPAPGEDDELEKERLRLKNGTALYQALEQCIHGLYSADGAVVEQLGAMAKTLGQMTRVDERLGERAGQLESFIYQVEDLTERLRDDLKQVDLDPQRLEAVEARLDTLNKLKRKYGGSLAAVLERADTIAEQLAAFETLDEAIERVRDDLQKGQQALCRSAAELTKRRGSAAEALAGRVEAELADLKMAGTRFAVDLQPLPAPREGSPHLLCDGRAVTETGADRAVFMIAPNVGEDLKPLAAIASGGELSRVVLALKAILAHGEALDTVVFDEVDAGIGGGTADGVGRKLAALARHHQVLCITHLPQIARYADHHMQIVKKVAKGRTHTTITPLNAEERVAEIARMLSGDAATATTLAHAREMLAERPAAN
ncbi:DNA repair protein RecN [Desulfatitalea alkaliphila]|uniref:DNA repair protein RecN n=1 Tax=Desulfatitalea alkaliphila TaxID=2929485 RepID=A0AA41UHC2_9BACT|nr:DNA repair protein RecN [Desulfatitalea alkaliphila]MCJ8499455.1 DNA repair protein RecN [Desulfatitalea alkaliphila]